MQHSTVPTHLYCCLKLNVIRLYLQYPSLYENRQNHFPYKDYCVVKHCVQTNLYYLLNSKGVNNLSSIQSGVHLFVPNDLPFFCVFDVFKNKKKSEEKTIRKKKGAAVTMCEINIKVFCKNKKKMSLNRCV